MAVSFKPWQTKRGGGVVTKWGRMRDVYGILQRNRMKVLLMRVFQALPARFCGKCGRGGKVKPLRLGWNLVVVQWQGQEAE